MSTTEKRFYLLVGESEEGPYSEQDILARVKAHEIDMDTLYSYEGANSWQSVSALVRQKSKERNRVADPPPFMNMVWPMPPASSPVKREVSRLVFRNPANGYEEWCENYQLWTLLFGGFYFASKGIWTHAFMGFVCALITFGISWLIYPLFTEGILRTHYLRLGWKEV